VVLAASCDEKSTPPVDINGTWSGLARDEEGSHRVTLQIVHDTTTGSVVIGVQVFRPDSALDDTFTLVGTVSGNDFTGQPLSAECGADIYLDVDLNSTKLSGTAVEQPGDSCGGGTVVLTFYKVLPPTQDVTGDWEGSFTGFDESGSLRITLAQAGGTVNGTVVATSDSGGPDTNLVGGRVIGNVFESATAPDSSDCVTYLLLEVETYSMRGIFGGSGADSTSGDSGCDHYGTVNLLRPLSKEARRTDDRQIR
jgi:hypothetical protein